MDFRPTCVYGHGPLVQLDGDWALTGVAVGRPLQAPHVGLREIVPNNQALALKVWRCSTCSAVQLFDEERP